MTFYDSNGKPIAYLEEDGVHIFLYNGKPVAYLSEDAVYSFSGKHLGWFENGWIRDLRGRCVFFTNISTGSGPIKPIKQIKPVKGVKHIKPIKGVKQVRKVKAVKSLTWNYSGVDFFNQ